MVVLGSLGARVAAMGGRECVELQRLVFPTWKGGSPVVFACCWQAPCPVE